MTIPLPALGFPVQPEDNSMELAASAPWIQQLRTMDTTDDETSYETDNESEKTPKKLRKKRQRPLNLVDTRKFFIDETCPENSGNLSDCDEPCPENSGSSSDSGSSIELSSSDDEFSNDK